MEDGIRESSRAEDEKQGGALRREAQVFWAQEMGDLTIIIIHV